MNDDWTGVEDVLRELPRTNSDSVRAERVRQRCHKTLARPRSLPAIARSAKMGRTFESVVVSGFCAVYFLGVALMALRTHGLL